MVMVAAVEFAGSGLHVKIGALVSVSKVFVGRGLREAIKRIL